MVRWKKYEGYSITFEKRTLVDIAELVYFPIPFRIPPLIGSQVVAPARQEYRPTSAQRGAELFAPATCSASVAFLLNQALSDNAHPLSRSSAVSCQPARLYCLSLCDCVCVCVCVPYLSLLLDLLILKVSQCFFYLGRKCDLFI